MVSIKTKQKRNANLKRQIKCLKYKVNFNGIGKQNNWRKKVIIRKYKGVESVKNSSYYAAKNIWKLNKPWKKQSKKNTVKKGNFDVKD